MTGTGTQNDPYIVDNWADYRNAVSQSSVAYIEFNDNSENKVIDFNEICPEGYSNTIAFSGNTKFNGWVFRNFYSVASGALIINGSGITGLNFENFYWQVPNSASYFIAGGSDAIAKNCNFSGKIAVTGSEPRFSNMKLSCCALNLSISFSGSSFKTCYYDIENSDIILDVVSANSFYGSYNRIINSRISGKISASQVNIDDSGGSGYNIINLESNQPLIYKGNGISVYNSDLAEKNSSSTKLVGCTPEQLKNAEYLYSIGFPIGID